MDFNIEIKARCSDQEDIRKILASANATYQGKDRQIDSYFNVNNGRLKLREGNIDSQLIHYDREDKEEPKISEYSIYKTATNSLLKELLTKALGLLVVVDKEREVYSIGNVKFHLDIVKNLGTFVEIEATGNDDDERIKAMEQCKYYIKLLRIKDKDLIPLSYSDLLINQQSNN